MSNKMDGLKIPVNNLSTESEMKDEVKKNVDVGLNKNEKLEPRKIIKKPAKKVEKKPVAKALLEKVKKEKATRNRSALASTLILVVVTAAVVGGVIYAWQKMETQKEIEEVKSETEVVKMDFEKRISNLKSKLTGTETDNVEMKKTLEELKHKAELLLGAKREYSDDALKINFDYPASFGLVTTATSSIASSTQLLGKFENNEKFVFGAIGKDYERNSTTTTSLFELKGFVEEKGKFQVLGSGEDQKFEVNPVKIMETSLGKAILLDKNSFVVEAGDDGLPVDIGGNVAVIVNLNNGVYSALVFVDSDFGVLSLDDFVKLVESIK